MSYNEFLSIEKQEQAMAGLKRIELGEKAPVPVSQRRLRVAGAVIGALAAVGSVVALMYDGAQERKQDCAPVLESATPTIETAAFGSQALAEAHQARADAGC